MEKRTCQRIYIEASIVCGYLTTGDNDKTFSGKMLNYGPSGMYVELGDRFKTGTILLVKTKNESTVQSGLELTEGFRSMSLAQVRWTKRVSINGEMRYGTGLQYV